VGDFASLIDEFLNNEFETSPVMASALGLTEYDDRLDDLSAAAFHKRDTDAAAWLKRFESAEGNLSVDDEIDRQLGIAILRGRLINVDWTPWKRDPLLYSSPILNGIFYLFLNRLRPTTELVDAAVARLEQAPAALQNGRDNLDPALANQLIVDRAMKSARAGASYLRNMLGEEADTDSQRDRLRVAGAVAGDALDEYAAHLEALAAEATGDWQYTEERYSRQLRERERLDFDARSLRELGQAEYDRLDKEMRRLAREINGSDDWRPVLDEANEDHPRTEEEMRRTYADWTDRARVFLAETGLVTLPDGESCAVEPSPPFSRPLFAVASYSGPPAFSNSLAGHFFVPIAPDGTTEDEIQKRLASNSFGSIPTVAVHEAYPGHHWHIMWSKIKAPRLRAVLTTPYFAEGWALYAERVMRERGFFAEPIQELYHLEATIFRAARIVVDTSLHMGEMSYDEAVDFMLTKTALTEPTAKAEVGRYCSWPTQASSYLTGCLEILRMRERYLDARGIAYDKPSDIPIDVLRDFHDTLAGSGKMPLGLAEQALMASIPETEKATV
jgi:uncharacterized protein (DUF885 family)